MKPIICLIAALCLLSAGGCSSDAQPPQSGGKGAAETNPAAKSVNSTTPATTKISSDDAPGIAIGEKAPELELPDQEGQPQTLQGLLKNGNVALVFYRSADW